MNRVQKKSRNTINQSLFLVVIAFCMLLAVAIVQIKSSQVTNNTNTATIIFNFSDGKERVFVGQVMDKMTVLEAVAASTQGDAIKVTYYIDNKNNVQLAAINDDLNTKISQWNFYLNHAGIRTEDIDKIYIKTNDLIEAKYQ